MYALDMFHLAQVFIKMTNIKVLMDLINIIVIEKQAINEHEEKRLRKQRKRNSKNAILGLMTKKMQTENLSFLKDLSLQTSF